MRKQPLVVANWKMYIESPAAAKTFVTALKRKGPKFAGVEAWIAPPYTLISELAKAAKASKIKIGAQNISAREGAHTGEVSVEMVRAAGAAFVIVGHSERRLPAQAGASGETNDMVRTQLAKVAGAGLTPILCVGEKEQLADGAHFSFIEEQLASATKGAQSILSKLIIAYEPVWAIGKSADQAMKPFDVQEMVIFIRKTLATILGRQDALNVPVLYGGSVEPANARDLITNGDVNGFLVGHAGADIDSFVEILTSCKK